MSASDNLQPLIGLEVHIQLKTESKLFCSCPVQADTPNTALCPTCLGLPGSKPVVNKKAVEHALRLALALHCKINPESYFSRKTYFYPDMVRNYQITQYEYPLAQEGMLVVRGKKISIRRIQLEEDPGSLIHEGGIAHAQHVLIDYNRSGIPLVELVTDPVFTSAKEARDFLEALVVILEYVDVYDAKNFTLRVDTNVSLGKNPRVEIKNITGFRAVEKAIEFEILRQKMAIDQGEKIVQETRHYDADSGDSISLREKETEEDYGYMFDPDLPKMVCDEKKIALIKKNMPELPQQRAERMMKQYQLSEYNAGIIASEKKMADFFEDVATKIDVDTTVKWMTGPLKKVLNYNGLSLSETDITSGHFITFLTMIKKGELTPRLGDLLLREFVLHPQDPKKLAEKMKFSVESNLEATVDAVVKKETKAVQDYQQGQQKAFDYLLGQIMRATGQKADMKEATKLLKKKLTR